MELRVVAPEDIGTWIETAKIAFGEEWDDATSGSFLGYVPPERRLAVHDGPRVVGTAATFPTELTVPGQGQLPAAAVTAVSVLPTHRRRGVGRRLLERQLLDAAGAGEAVAVLNASEYPIYWHFGYGPATVGSIHTLDTARARLLVEPDGAGTFAYVDGDAVLGSVAEVFERVRVTVPGEIARPLPYWKHLVNDPPAWRDGGTARRYVVHHDGHGRPDGYVSYRVKDEWQGYVSHSQLHVLELMSTAPDAYVALWDFCLRMDLIASVSAYDLTADEPLRWLLADQRRLVPSAFHDFLWVRLVDVPTALEARTYGQDGVLVLEVDDPLLPGNRGRWLVSQEDGKVTCEPTGQEPDLRLGVAELGALYLGGHRPWALAAAGRIAPASSAALQRAGRMLAADREPRCSSEF